MVKGNYIFILVMVIITVTGCKKSADELIIFHAGSLTVPFKEITADFNKTYPGIKVQLEAAGSRRCARKITDLKRECDVMASADYAVIDNLLIPDYADWNIKFASNEMAITYHEQSKRGDEITAENWYEILSDPAIAFGRSDPNSDPCGYRAVLTMKLAAKYYNNPAIKTTLLEKDTRYIRPKEVDLLALLESHTIDYIFLYRSVAEQHGLKYVLLPDEINLKNPEYSDYYKNVKTKISGKDPETFIEKSGAPMVYGVTIVKNAPHMDNAMKFVRFLLSQDKGGRIMEKNGQPSIVPSKSKTYANIPESLKVYATK